MLYYLYVSSLVHINTRTHDLRTSDLICLFHHNGLMNEAVSNLCKDEGFTTLPVNNRHWRSAFSVDDRTSGPQLYYTFVSPMIAISILTPSKFKFNFL